MTSASSDRARATVLGVPVDRVSCREAAGRIAAWAQAHSSRVVLAANVHMTMEAVDDPRFRALMEGADLIVADGRPLVWSLRLRGCRDASHVRGQDLVLAVCDEAARLGLEVGLYGTTDAVLDAASADLRARCPGLRIVYAVAPPFGPLEATEDAAVERAIADAGTRILLVSLGCPKQERWMAARAGRIQAVMIGAGAAIDMIGGLQPVAPLWAQRLGLEWCFRLASDPRRLWRRYARHNLRFLVFAGREVAAVRWRSRAARVWGRRG